MPVIHRIATARRMISAVTVIALAVGAGLATAGPALARPAHARQAQVRLIQASVAQASVAQARAAAARRPVDGLAAVSCKGSFCMAVGTYTDRHGRRHALAERWNGRAWRTLANPVGRALTGVSCSGSTFCMGVGGPTGLEAWHGNGWRTLSRTPGSPGPVSCGSPRLCMAIDNGLVESWNGSRWRIWKQATERMQRRPAGPVRQHKRVLCQRDKLPRGRDRDGLSGAGSGAHGVRVGRQEVLRLFAPGYGNPAMLNAVTCTRGLCMAAGGGFAEVDNGDLAMAEAWHPATKTWTTVSPDLGVICTGFTTCGWTSELACGSATTCLTLSSFGTMAWNGTTWKPAEAISAGRGSALRDVSCAGTSCMAVGFRTAHGVHQTLAELRTPKGWRILRTTNPG